MSSEESAEATSNLEEGEQVVEVEEETSEAESGDFEIVAENDSEVQDVKKEEQKGAGEKKRRRRTRAKREVTLPLEKIAVGMELEGTVRSVMEYGAFVGDMGTPTDGLLHVSQLKSGYVEKVSDVVEVGQKLKVRVLSVDLNRGNFSLTMKTQEELAAEKMERTERRGAERANRKENMSKKWDEFSFDPKVFVDAQVTSVTEFGAFCMLLDDSGNPSESVPTEGLVHISELAEGRVEQVTDVLQEQQKVKVRVVSADRDRNRISLSLREWKDFKAERNDDSGKQSDFSKEIAASKSSQPVFKTSMELAFEKARAVSAAKEAASSGGK